MSLHQSIHDSLKAIWSADTGSGGLNASGDQRVYRWERWGHPDIASERAGPYPFVLTQIANEESLNPFASTADGGGAQLVIRCHLYTIRDQNYTQLNAAVTRMRTVLNGVAPASANSWSFGAMQHFRQLDAPSTGDAHHAVIELSVLAQKA